MNLANALSSSGDNVAAEPLYIRALEGYEEARGNEHPETIQCINCLAECLREQVGH